MEICIIGGIVMVLIAAGIYSTIKRIRSKTGCCSSGGYRLRRKRLKNVISQKTFRVDGMHCAGCRARVEEIVNDIHGISGKVDLKKGELTVFYAEAVEDDLIRSRLAKAGYFIIT
ncbi:MAG: heavy-metal-associated domain-containing protein [Eubacteriales bacterium]